MAYTVVIPALKRMDHCQPVIEYIRESVRDEKPEIHVVFVPLLNSIRGNLQAFVDFWSEKNLDDSYETCVVWDKSIEDFGMTWHDAWKDWISSVEYLTKGTHLSQIFIALSPELPNGIILASATSALSVPNLKLIEMPGGYDLSIRRAEFLPAAPKKDQIIHYPTWGDADVQKPIMAIASKPEIGLTLSVIRHLAERQGGGEVLVNRPVKRTEISKQLLSIKKQTQKKSTEVSVSMISKRLSVLKEHNLIGKCWVNKDESYSPLSFHLTPEGVNISGLLRNVWELHSMMDE